MSVEWKKEEREEIDGAIQRHPVASGRCAALARAVLRVAQPDETARGSEVGRRGVPLPVTSCRSFLIHRGGEATR